MSNILDKTLFEMKRVGKVICKSAGEIGGAIGEATVNISAHTKKVAKVSILKAEMDNIYYELGKAVFEEGLLPSNEVAMTYMEELFDKMAELDVLENELKFDEDVCSCEKEDCSCADDECSCGDVCDCHEDVPVEETPVEETPENIDEVEKSE